MADPTYLGKVFDTLTEPIRERPISSLFFSLVFAVLFAAGLYPQKTVPVLDQLRPILLTLLVMMLFLALLSVHRLLVSRDDPSRLKDPTVLEGIKQSFVGRDEDAKDLTELILNSYQVWLNGDSGVGKSVLLQKAILPELEKRGITAVYLNSWRGDWELAPASAVLARLNATADGGVLDRLAQVLAATSGRVIILDQFDEFQIGHRDKFIPARGQVISRAQLEASNQFFRILNSAVRERRLRCVFVTRRDVEWGKRAVLFEDADEFFLNRLARNLMEGEIARVVPAAAVEHPENGWDGLRERLCHDLSDEGILPVQMRFAVLGLDELRHRLTVSAYLQIGGAPGLISRYIEREVRRVAGDKSLALALFPLLRSLITPDGKATVPIPEEELLKLIPDGPKSAVMQALEDLERRDIVRRVLNPDGTVLWRLDHDYLAGPVREISRRQTPEQWEMKDRLDRYLAAPAWQKPLKLADPFTVSKLLRARLFKGLRFGPAAPWILFSVGAFLLALAALTYTGFGAYEWFADKELGQRLFNVFSSGQTLLQPISSVDVTALAEAKALLALEGSHLTARKVFLATALDSGENAGRLSAHLFPIAIALTHSRSNVANRLYLGVIRSVLSRPQSDAEVLRAAFGLMNFWQTASSLDTHDVQQLAATLVERMLKEKNGSALRELASGLGSMQDRVKPQTIQAAATALEDRMSKETDLDLLEASADSLGLFKDKVDPATAQKLATMLLERMSKEPFKIPQSNYQLHWLEDKVDSATAQKLNEAGLLLSHPTDFTPPPPFYEKDSPAAMLLQKMSKETDAATLRETAANLSIYPEGTLNQKDLPTVSAAFAIPYAPCAVLLAFDSTTQEIELPKLLRNPLCDEYDWRQLALRAAQISGQPIARQKEINGEIVVDFPKLSDYLSSQESWRDRVRLSLSEVAALVFLILALVAFALALLKSRDQRLPLSAA